MKLELNTVTTKNLPYKIFHLRFKLTSLMLVVEVLLLEAGVSILVAEVDQVVVVMEDQEILLLNHLVEGHNVNCVTSTGILFGSVIFDSTTTVIITNYNQPNGHLSL